MIAEIVEVVRAEQLAFLNDGMRCLRNCCGGAPGWFCYSGDVCDIYCSRHAIDFCAFFGIRQPGRLIVGDAVRARAVESARRREAQGGAARVERRR